MGVQNFTNNPQNGSGTPAGGSQYPPTPPGAMSNFHPEDLMINLNKKPHTPTLFRDNVIAQLMSVLIGESKPNALLVGPAGTGKTKIAEELAHRIETKDPSVPPMLGGYTIWSLQLSDIVAGSGIVGELEEKVNQLVEYLSYSKNKAIVFIDELHVLFSGEIYKKIAQILKPALSRGAIKTIGATTTQESKSLDEDPAFNRRFTKVLVDELSKEQTVEILANYRSTLVKHYNTTFNFDNDLAKTIVNIADNFCSAGSHRPDNALTLLDRSIAGAIIQKQQMLSSPDPMVQQMAQAMRGVMLSEQGIQRTAYKITTGNNEPKLFDESAIRSAFTTIRGQDDIIEKLMYAIRRRELNTRPKRQPLTFLFAGSSGVGKTEVVKILADSYIGEKPIMLNMAEYHSSASINRIIGAPAGYVGYNDNGELPFDILDTNPYQIILLDEFEKCNREVQRLFMEVFQEGTLKTNKGKTIDFSKAIIVATTNAGCTVKSGTLGFNREEHAEKTVDDLSGWFDIELLNRFNYRVTFNDITRDMFREIARDYYARDVAAIKAIKPRTPIADQISDADLDAIVEKHYNPKLGARPVRTAIEDFIDDTLLAASPAPAAAPVQPMAPMPAPSGPCAPQGPDDDDNNSNAPQAPSLPAGTPAGAAPASQAPAASTAPVQDQGSGIEVLYEVIQTDDAVPAMQSKTNTIVTTYKPYFDQNGCLDDGASGLYYSAISAAMLDCGAPELMKSYFEVQTDPDDVIRRMRAKGFVMLKDPAFTALVTQDDEQR